jgi:hypothetical protein
MSHSSRQPTYDNSHAKSAQQEQGPRHRHRPGEKLKLHNLRVLNDKDDNKGNEDKKHNSLSHLCLLSSSWDIVFSLEAAGITHRRKIPQCIPFQSAGNEKKMT